MPGYVMATESSHPLDLVGFLEIDSFLPSPAYLSNEHTLSRTGSLLSTTVSLEEKNWSDVDGFKEQRLGGDMKLRKFVLEHI